MASPDATPYVDLRLLDVSAQDLFANALQNLVSYLPEWTPREGHTEVLLLESFASEVAEAVFAINRLPGAVLEALLRLYQVERDLGQPPTVSVRFTVVDTAGYIIPAGTRVAVTIDSLGAGNVLLFATNTALAVPPGSLTGTVVATALSNTAVANGSPAGGLVELVDSVAVADRVDLVSSVGGGADVESDIDWFTRGVQRFSRLTETLVLPRHFTAAALEFDNVERAFTLDNYDPAVGASPGHITVAVYGLGTTISVADKATIAATMDAQAQANLAVHIVDPTITTINVTASIVVLDGYSATVVKAAVVAAIRAYLSPAQWGWGSTLYVNELISSSTGSTASTGSSLRLPPPTPRCLGWRPSRTLAT